MLSRLRRLHAGCEELDEFGAVVTEGGESLVGFDELGIAQELKPVLRLCSFLERDLKLGGEVGLTLCIAALRDVRADGSAGAQHLFRDDRFLAVAKILLEANNTQGECP